MATQENITGAERVKLLKKLVARGATPEEAAQVAGFTLEEAQKALGIQPEPAPEPNKKKAKTRVKPRRRVQPLTAAEVEKRSRFQWTDEAVEVLKKKGAAEAARELGTTRDAAQAKLQRVRKAETPPKAPPTALSRIGKSLGRGAAATGRWTKNFAQDATATILEENLGILGSHLGRAIRPDKKFKPVSGSGALDLDKVHKASQKKIEKASATVKKAEDKVVKAAERLASSLDSGGDPSKGSPAPHDVQSRGGAPSKRSVFSRMRGLASRSGVKKAALAVGGTALAAGGAYMAYKAFSPGEASADTKPEPASEPKKNAGATPGKSRELVFTADEIVFEADHIKFKDQSGKPAAARPGQVPSKGGGGPGGAPGSPGEGGAPPAGGGAGAAAGSPAGGAASGGGEAGGESGPGGGAPPGADGKNPDVAPPGLKLKAGAFPVEPPPPPPTNPLTGGNSPQPQTPPTASAGGSIGGGAAPAASAGGSVGGEWSKPREPGPLPPLPPAIDPLTGMPMPEPNLPAGGNPVPSASGTVGAGVTGARSAPPPVPATPVSTTPGAPQNTFRVPGSGPAATTPAALGPVSGNPAGAGTFRVPGSDVQARVADRLGQLGYTHIQTAAIMGNIKQESGFNTGAHNTKGEDSLGLFQWNAGAGRQQPMRNWMDRNGRDIRDPVAQVDYFHHEMNTTYRKAGEALRNSTTVYDANRAMKRFEGYGDNSFNTRLGYANQYQNWLAQRGRAQPQQSPTASGGASANPGAGPTVGANDQKPGGLGEPRNNEAGTSPRIDGSGLSRASGSAMMDRDYPENTGWKSAAAKDSVQNVGAPSASQSQPQTDVPSTSVKDHFSDGFPGLGDDVDTGMLGMAE